MARPEPKRYTPRNPEKYVGNVDKIIARSSWEVKMMRWLDMNPSVLMWNSEEIVIPYFSNADERWRNYYVDFIAKIRTPDGPVVYLLEIKPHYQTIPPKQGRKRAKTYLKECHTYQVNQDKWKMAEAYCQENGMRWLVLTEYDLGIAKR